MEQFGITLYYTDNHPANGQPFFTEKELIEEAQDICKLPNHFKISSIT